MPTGSTYMVDYTLTNYAVSYYATQTDNLASFLAPPVSCPGLLGTYKVYDRGDAFSVVDTQRGLYESARTIDVSGKEVAYKLESHALQIGIDDDELLGAGREATYRDQLRHIKTAKLTRTMMLSHNKRVFDLVNSAIPLTTSCAGHANIGVWSGDNDAAKQLKTLVREFHLANGVYPNRLLASVSAWDIMGANASIKDAIRYNSVNELSSEQLRKIMGYDEMGQQIQIRHTAIPYNTQLPGVEGSNADVLGNMLYLYYCDETPSMDDISAVKTLNVDGESEITSVESMRDDEHSTEWLRVKRHVLPVVTAPSCMMRIAVS